ncbi:hypothetical protein VTH06DRAFT_3600 [Thermothelomyces fergusii]
MTTQSWGRMIRTRIYGCMASLARQAQQQPADRGWAGHPAAKASEARAFPIRRATVRAHGGSPPKRSRSATPGGPQSASKSGPLQMEPVLDSRCLML